MQFSTTNYYPDMEENMKPKVRNFGGETEFVLDYSTPETLEASKKHRHFHQRMLRAYLKGKEVFNFGRHYETLLFKNVPTEHKVLVKWV